MRLSNQGDARIKLGVHTERAARDDESRRIARRRADCELALSKVHGRLPDTVPACPATFNLDVWMEHARKPVHNLSLSSILLLAALLPGKRSDRQHLVQGKRRIPGLKHVAAQHSMPQNASPRNDAHSAIQCTSGAGCVERVSHPRKLTGAVVAHAMLRMLPGLTAQAAMCPTPSLNQRPETCVLLSCRLTISAAQLTLHRRICASAAVGLLLLVRACCCMLRLPMAASVPLLICGCLPDAAQQGNSARSKRCTQESCC